MGTVTNTPYGAHRKGKPTYFVGLDLAWVEGNQTGIAVLDFHGRLLCLGTAKSDDGICEVLEPYLGGDCLVAFDAPLIVANPAGQRPAEALLNRDFAPFHAGAHPANTSNPIFDPPRAAVLASRLGLDMDPRSASGRRAIEVYPHPATIALFGLGRTLKYKRRNPDVFDRRRQLVTLTTLVDGLAHGRPALRLTGHPGWAELRVKIADATRPCHLNACEDVVDAVVCAYIALFSEERPEDIVIYGHYQTGYIVTPRLPPGSKPLPRIPNPAAPRGASGR